MGNPFKGDVAFDVEGAPYIMSLRTNALACIQEDFGTGFNVEGNRTFLLRLMSAPQSFADLRTVVFHGLQEHHNDTVTTKQDAGNLMDKVGRKETIGIVERSLEWAFPPRKKKGAGTDPKAKTTTPTSDASGTGGASS